MSTNDPINIVYFGGEPIGVPVLEELADFDIVPRLVVASPDRPVGRKQIMTPPPVKVWAQEHEVAVWQPETWRGEAAQETAQQFLAPLLAQYDNLVFVVVAYNHILPQWLLDMAPQGVINVHPSLLPKLRGASPIRTAIRDDLREHIGVSIMLLDDQMDHGPILEQMALPIADEYWPVAGPELDVALARMGGALLADVLPRFIAGEITPTEQDHTQATYCIRFAAADRELRGFDPYSLPSGTAAAQHHRHVAAFAGIGETYFVHNNQRVKVTKAEISPEGNFRPVTVIPEGKNEQAFAAWHQAKRGDRNSHRTRD